VVALRPSAVPITAPAVAVGCFDAPGKRTACAGLRAPWCRCAAQLLRLRGRLVQQRPALVGVRVPVVPMRVATVRVPVAAHQWCDSAVPGTRKTGDDDVRHCCRHGDLLVRVADPVVQLRGAAVQVCGAAVPLDTALCRLEDAPRQRVDATATSGGACERSAISRQERFQCPSWSSPLDLRVLPSFYWLPVSYRGQLE
jgi:hypothetical protein